MSDDDNDNPVEDEAGGPASSDSGPSVFEMFEPPPDIDASRFGPIPVVGEDDAPTPTSADGDPVSPGDESISAIFGFDPIPEETPAEGAESASSTELPHWTEPATGLVPEVVATEGDSGDSWSEVGGPRWHGEGPQWAGDDLEAVFADEDGVDLEGKVTIDDDPEAPLIPSAAGAPQREQPSPVRAAQRPQVAVDTGERDLVQAIVFGVLLAALAALAFWWGKVPTVILISAAAALGAGELYDAMRKAGLHPATLLGIAAAVALPLAAYNEGEAGFTLVIGMSVVFGALWYLVGADNHRPALNLSLTMLGITWVGGMAAFAALLVRADQVEVLLAAVLVTVASDVGAFAGGKALGVHPFHPASPNKTWEGTIVGLISAIVMGLIVGILGISVFADSLTNAVLFGLVIGLLAPLGDLTESPVKRDLGVKDMSSLIPGHGGILDRLDGLLFAMPAAYYLGGVLDLF